MTLYPLKLSPEASPRLWGGSRLKDMFPAFSKLESSEPIGEAWLIYKENLIENGPLQGQCLQAVADDYGTRLLGNKSVQRYGQQIPLLAKLIDAADTLSIQVHPDDSYAQKYEAASGHLGKSEAWLILHSEPDASIFWGWNQNVSAELIREAVEQGTLEHYLNSVPVKVGDIIYNPPGTVHAIGAGILLYEIQQSSDLTYRLYDFRRRDKSGKLRELHVDKALAVSDLSVGEQAKQSTQVLGSGITRLISTDYFITDEHTINGNVHLSTTNSLELLSLLDGQLVLEWSQGTLELQASDSLVIPAELTSYSVQGTGRLLRSYLP